MTDQNHQSPYVLYGSVISYYTGKARSYLDWKKIPYEERASDRKVYETIIVPRIGYPMIPLVITPEDEAIQDTSEIIDYFEAANPATSARPATPRQAFAAALFELYGDEWLVIPAMHYRWAHNQDFAYGEFGRLIAPALSKEEQFEAGKKAATRFQGSVPLLGASPEMAGAIEASYVALLKDFQAHFEKYDYLFGDRPSIGDFGLYGPLYAHQYRDPASGSVMKEHAPALVDWILRMQTPPATTGDFLSEDEIPATLLPILARMMSEQLPCLIDLEEKLSIWKTENPDTDIPRAIGMHAFTVEGQTGQRIILPYTQWMLQRALETRDGFDEAGKAAIADMLQEVGGEALATLTVRAPVKRENYKLVWAA